MTDREIVEYFGEGVELHKITSRMVNIDKDICMYECSCGRKLMGGFCYFEEGDKGEVEAWKLEHLNQNPTPTLEWMVSKLNEKGYVVELWQSPSQTEHKADIIFFKNKYKGYGKTPALALRGAVEKMMEVEDE